ncbi:MAG: universal stress protein [Comamonadaceae bacterium]|uniref:Universal stress protein n=1 Tax=Hydrogenophaga borbori TaxID=2294117 RepID=A0A372EQI7_9BURK|nr:universal stress protein [Hydrogenophaga borbori]NCT96129.1 universal stress protein [Comamonadaceae bacterium]RFP82812.1 universal stress protein [Hydrogenophaga borbori]
MKILIAADGSACTKRLLAFIAAHDEWLGPQHRYTVLHCVPAIPHRAAAFVGKPQVQALYRDDAETVLRPIRTFLNRHLQGVAFVHRVGSPGSTIAKFASERRFDLVMMGTHGHGAMAGLVMGSVATKVMSLCRTPVLLVR